MVLKSCGPIGYQGFPETGDMSLPTKLLKQGVTDLVRISDACIVVPPMVLLCCTAHRKPLLKARSHS